MFRFRSRRPTLGGVLLLVLFFFGLFVAGLLSSTYLLWHGITTQGVITAQGTVSCGKKSSTGQEFSVRFTDQAGRVHTSTISQCAYGGFNASFGDSVAIVYLPDDPTTIAPPEELMSNARAALNGTIVLSIITLILLLLWIRKRIKKSSLQAQ